MRLLKCVVCRTYIVHAKEHIRMHEAAYHEYKASRYNPHHHVPLTKVEKDRIVAQGEQRIGKQHFIGFGVETDVLAKARN